MEILRATNEKVLKIVTSVFEARLGLKKIFRNIGLEMVNHINPFLTYLMFILNTMKEMIGDIAPSQEKYLQ